MSGKKDKDDFVLKGNSDEGFNSRKNSVFDSLVSLEQTHKDWQKAQNPTSNKNLWKEEPEELEIPRRNFKRPFAPDSNRRSQVSNRPIANRPSLPGFQENPSQWVKYSLSDVSDYDTSDKANTEAALSFIHERKRLKLQNPSEESISSEKPVFRKPPRIQELDTDEHCGGSTSNTTKIIMPEYVVGLACPKKNKKSSSFQKLVVTSDRNVSLEHLNEEEMPAADTLTEPLDDQGSSSIQFKSVKRRNMRSSSEMDDV